MYIFSTTNCFVQKTFYAVRIRLEMVSVSRLSFMESKCRFVGCVELLFFGFSFHVWFGYSLYETLLRQVSAFDRSYDNFGFSWATAGFWFCLYCRYVPFVVLESKWMACGSYLNPVGCKGGFSTEISGNCLFADTSPLFQQVNGWCKLHESCLSPQRIFDRLLRKLKLGSLVDHICIITKDSYSQLANLPSWLYFRIW